MRSVDVSKLILAAALALIVPGCALADDTSAITETALKGMYQSAEQLHKVARDLDAEANRHAVLESFNGMFGSAPPSMLFPYQNYSADAMMPIDTSLATDYSQGNLVPPRPDVANQLYNQLNESLMALVSESQKVSVPDNANSDLKVQWSILQQQLAMAQKDQIAIAKIIQDKVILQEPFMDATRKLLTDANSIDSVLKQLEKHAKHLN